MSRIRDINWSVDFDICIDGKDAKFWDLSESEQQKILNDIFEDFYSGTFLGDEEE